MRVNTLKSVESKNMFFEGFYKFYKKEGAMVVSVRLPKRNREKRGKRSKQLVVRVDEKTYNEFKKLPLRSVMLRKFIEAVLKKINKGVYHEKQEKEKQK